MIVPIPSFARNITSPQTRVNSSKDLFPDPSSLPDQAKGALTPAKFVSMEEVTGHTKEYIRAHSIVNGIVQGVQGSTPGKAANPKPLSDAEIKKILDETIV